MTHFEFMETAIAIAGLGMILYFSNRLKGYLKNCLKMFSV